ncbi:protein unc-79 homolog [Sinocyclocheilus anshuiensis]|uniref:protein unc-79 homolog n=1 Tax=Sinocyclocheilus anshuiensis TaxID=1608454 RepID=UPI0007B82FD8|nr:PREDICTED: protein unc-79 homolog [Sinocyclocheilus anshuiensis]
MSTKAEQFGSKIRYLQEYHNRVLHNIYPVPSGTDIANTLKYFSQTLLSILSRTGRKESQEASNLAVPMTMCLFPVPFPLTPSLRPQVSSINPTVTRSLLYSVLRDAPADRGGATQQSREVQISDYPSLDYQGLYATLVTLLDLVPLLQHGQHDLGQAIFYTTTCLLPFLSDDILSTLPYTMISTLATFPPFLHKDIIEYLSTSFLPMAILGSTRREGGIPAYVNLSASSMLMVTMQYTSNPVYHCQLLECLMKYKQEVWKDLLYVISYGPSQVKPPAVQMLFHYWPNLKPPGAISEYRGLQYTAWNPIHCQHLECQNSINKPAVKMCIDPTLSVALGDKPPPLYICEECSQRIAGDHAEWLVDVLLPQAEISAICQKKNCSSHVRRAIVTCFSAGCCGRHGNRPVRYCKRCHVNHHSSEVGASAETHLYQTSPPPINTRECAAEELVCTVEAVISLLKEAEIHAELREFELNRRRQMGLSSSHHSLDNMEFDNKEDDQHDQRLLSQFGIWFLVSLCTPSENTPTESLARLVSMVFQWFHSTAYMMDDEVGSLVEKLKPQFVTKWLKTVCDVRFDVMVMCLLPKPVEFARVGAYWDKSCSTVTQLKEGLNRILCLIPYNVISQPLWECFMPEWLEAIRTEVPDHQLREFREVLSKMFDIELCPLPFSMEEMFGFISCRFSGYPASVQEQALLWLHVSAHTHTQSSINSVLQAPWGGSHTCQKDEKALECSLCQSSILCYHLACDLLQRLTPREETRLVGCVLSPLLYYLKSENGADKADAPSENPGSHNPSPEIPPLKNSADRKFSYLQLPVSLKLLYTILQEMSKFEEPDILFNMLSCLKILCLHGECLYHARKDQPQFLAYIQEKMLIPSLWSMLRSEFCQLASLAVLQLLHALALSHGADIFWRLVDSSFNSQDWKIRFEAVERVAVLCRFLDMGSVTKSHVLKYSLAHAFCCFLASIEDVNPAVATRARLLLDSIKRPALQGLCLCLDFQFDTVVRDRPVILSKLLLLHSLRQEIPALSWEFFVNRFETLSLEAQLHLDCNKEFPFPTTITAVRTNVANLSDAAMWKIRRARFARNRQKSVRSLRESVKGSSGSKRTFSLPETLCNKLPLRLIRQEQSAPSLGNMLEKVLTRESSPPEDDSVIKDLLPEDAGIDHQTVHQLIMVLMKFMAKDKSSAEADIGSAKAFNTVKRHLYVLLGYDQQMGCFMITPQKMRSSTCFNAFIAGIAQVMDYNIGLGKHLLPLVVQVLKYCTCPQLRPNFQEPPRCSLWALKPHTRQMWLRALLVILYKYPYREMDMSKEVVLHLIHITINTLNAQYHSCRSHVSAGPLYSDNSNISRYSEKEKEEDSVFDESDIHDTPTGASSKESQTFFARLKRIGGSKSVKYQPVELNTQRSEIELAEYKEGGVLQDTLLYSGREDSNSKKKRLQAMHKQKSLDISNTDSILFNLDEHRRKSCIDRCDLQGPPALQPSSSSSIGRQQHRAQHHGKHSSNGHSVTDRRGSAAQNDSIRPIIPEVRLSCMETFEDKPVGLDSPLAAPALDKDDPDLIDLSSDCTSIPEKHSILSLSDSDSLVFEPLPPLRIVESNEDLFEALKLPGGVLSKSEDPSVASISITAHSTPVVQVSIEDCTKNKKLEPPAVSLPVSLELPDSAAPQEATMTLKQKRDLFRKTSHMPNASLDDSCMQPKDSGGTSPSSRSVVLQIPADELESLDPLNGEGAGDEDNDETDERDSDPKPDDESDEAEFKIQIVPRQRKERKIAVSAIQREYLDISFSTIDKMKEPATESEAKSLSSLEKPRESASAPALEATIPETSHRSSVSTLYRQVKRGSLGAVTMSQLMKRQLEHQSSTPQNINTWDTDGSFLRTLATSLIDFNELSSVAALSQLLEVRLFISRTTDTPVSETSGSGVAKQFLRCVLHQLAPNGILPQLFQSNIKDGSFLRTLATSLIDFNELSSVAALSQLLEGLNNKKTLPAGGTILHCLDNIATFMETLPMDSPSNLWTTISNQFHTFLTKLPAVLPLKCPLDSSLRIIICLLKIPVTNATRSLLEPFSKLLSFVLQYGVFSLSYLVELCGLCYKTFSKERDKFYMSRVVVLELLQALKFKSSIPDTNLLLLVQFVCTDIGTRLAESTILQKHMISALPGCTTAAMECLRQYLSELLDFIADMHTLTKLKSHMKACCQPLHEDTFGGNLKVGLAQIAAMEISKGNHRDNKAVIRYLPWLYHPPSAMQQGPKEFIECVSHIRQLSWLLLGSLTHSALHQGSSCCMPIPLDAGSHIADHLIVILIGFPEQSKTSVLHMCSLFHAFMFAQLWTIYCEQATANPTNQNQNEFSSCAILTGLEFWSRVTPSILQLMAHNKVMVEMVCLHVISLMEALQECNSTIFVKLIPMWLPMIQSNLNHLSAGLQLRLQAIQNRVNHQCLQNPGSGSFPLTLRKWLQCTQFKMAQVEIQSSEAASQFYPM